MHTLELLIDLYKQVNRQGPGGATETEKALDLAMIDRSHPLKIADIGCGTGASTLTLARLLSAHITAVDLLQDFLDVLARNAERAGLSDKIQPLCCSMDNLPFTEAAFDVIWAEGAIYNIGFHKGVTDWKRYLKPGGLLIASEISWTTHPRPAAIQEYWDREYPEIDLASAKISILENSSYSPVGYFVLPEHCWLDNFYRPLQASFTDFLKRNENSEQAHAVVEKEQREIELYEQYKDQYSYGFYIARKLAH